MQVCETCSVHSGVSLLLTFSFGLLSSFQKLEVFAELDFPPHVYTREGKS